MATMKQEKQMTDQNADLKRLQARQDIAIGMAREELERATALFGAFPSPHHGFSAVLEECIELMLACFWGKGDPVEEATQLAAMAIRYLMDCTDVTHVGQDYDPEPSPTQEDEEQLRELDEDEAAPHEAKDWLTQKLRDPTFRKDFLKYLAEQRAEGLPLTSLEAGDLEAHLQLLNGNVGQGFRGETKLGMVMAQLRWDAARLLGIRLQAAQELHNK